MRKSAMGVAVADILLVLMLSSRKATTLESLLICFFPLLLAWLLTHSPSFLSYWALWASSANHNKLIGLIFLSGLYLDKPI